MIVEREAFRMFLVLQQKFHFTAHQLLQMNQEVESILQMLPLVELTIPQEMIPLMVMKILDP